MSRREWAALVAWAVLLGLVGAIILVQGTASATRPTYVPPADKCANLVGVQSVEEFRAGLVRWRVRTPVKGDCRKVRTIR